MLSKEAEAPVAPGASRRSAKYSTRSLDSPLGRCALDLAAREISVFRLPPGTKVPYAHSHGYRDATTNAEQIRAWWSDTPEANIGIATGSKSNGLVVADIDKPDRARLPGSSTLRLPSAPLVKTRRGYHVYCFSSNPFNSQTLPWGDLQAEGRYVVAPPSITDGVLRDWLVPLEWEQPLPVYELAGFLPGLEGLREDLENPLDPERALSLGLVSLGALLEAENYAALVGREEVAAALQAKYGLPEVGKHFNCPLHPGRKHANLWRARNGAVRWYCHSRHGKQNLCLGRLHAVLQTGTLPQTKNQLAFWARKLILDLGFVYTGEIDLPKLPEGLPRSRYTLREAAQEVFRVWGTSQPRPLATSFLRQLSGLSKQTVISAKGDLIEHGVICKVGEHASGYGTPMSLYLPGDLA